VTGEAALINLLTADWITGQRIGASPNEIRATEPQGD
jgi:hypothetical protein